MGKEKIEGPGCGKMLALMHVKTHLKKYYKNLPPESVIVAPPGPYTGTRPKKECNRCGAWITSNNLSRLMQHCGDPYIAKAQIWA